MKKVILGFTILIIVFLLTFLISGIVRKLGNQKIITEKISTLPSFSFLTLMYEAYDSKDIKTGPILIVHFHPECEHCQYEISEILKSKIPSSFARVFLISSANPDSIKSFLNLLNFNYSQTIIPLLDTANYFEDIFGSGIIPSSYIYNRKLNLVKVLHGEVKTETILKYFTESE